MPSPHYDFESVDILNTDNEWWGDDVWKMLVTMNARGLATHESEDNGHPQSKEVETFQRNNKVMGRASVSGVLRNDRDTLDLSRNVHCEGMIAYAHPFQQNDVYRSIRPFSYPAFT